MRSRSTGRFANIITVLAVIIASVASFVALEPATATGQNGGRAGAPTISQRATVDTGDLSLTVSATGTAAVTQESNLSFDVSGTVKTIKVQEGQHVVKGQVLATLDDSSQQSAVQQAQLTLQAAQAALDKILAPVDPNQIALAQADIKAAQGAVYSKNSGITASSISVYQARVTQAQTDRDNAQKLLNDAGGHYGQSDPNYQLALAQEGQADLNLQIAKLNLQEAQKGSPTGAASANVALNQAKLAQLLAGPTQSSIDVAKASVVAAQTALDQARQAADMTILSAPYDGTITHINIQVGTPASGTAMIIDDLSTLYVVVNVDEADINSVAAGQKVDLTFDALQGQNFSGTVNRITPIADASTSVITYPVLVTLDKAPTTSIATSVATADAANSTPASGNSASNNGTNSVVRAGMTANAVLTVQQVHNVLRIPNSFLRVNRTTGQTTVSLLGADGVTPITVPVKTGIQGTDYTEIIDGVKAGDTVILAASGGAGGAGSGAGGAGGRPGG